MRTAPLKLHLPAPVRSADADLLDIFLVAAVSTVLAIRIFLEATGYPRLGGSGLHIAHVLWGGFGMLVAILILLLFLSSTTRVVAAILGGAGFGAFIDELGKFVTSDNDYFYKPTAALLYVIFVLLFLGLRSARLRRPLTPEENLVNAIELAEKQVMGSLSESDRARALQQLDRSDATDPLVGVLRERFLGARVRGEHAVGARRLAGAVQHWYARIAGTVAFRRVIAAIFVLQGLAFVLSVIAGVALVVGVALGDAGAREAFDDSLTGSTVTSWIEVVAALLAGGLIFAGVVSLRRSRVHAYHLFELAILVDLLLAQPFAFLDSGFSAALGVSLDVAVLATLRYLQTMEHALGARSYIARPSPA